MYVMFDEDQDGEFVAGERMQAILARCEARVESVASSSPPALALTNRIGASR
jgi:hypothetical protein